MPLRAHKDDGVNTDMKRLSLQFEEASGLKLHTDGVAKAVYPKRTFPWSQPLALISLRDEADREVAFIQDLAELSVDSQKALGNAIEHFSNTFEVQDILDTLEEYEMRSWRVRTSEGARVFQTALDARPTATTDGHILIQDINSDHYVIRQLAGLPERAQNLLQTVMR